MYKILHMTEGTSNENRVCLIKEVLNRMEKIIKNVPENRKFKIEENKKITDIVERILYFNQLSQSRQGLKTLTQTKGLVDYQLL